MLSPNRMAIELGTTWSPTTGETTDAGHLVLDHLLRTRAIFRTGPIELGGSLEIGPLTAGTPVNDRVATRGYGSGAAVLIGLQARGIIVAGELFAFGALAEAELAFLPYFEIVNNDWTDTGTQLDAMLRAGPWVSVTPIEQLTFVTGTVVAFHPLFVTDYIGTAGFDSDARKQAGVLTYFVGLSATAGPATFVGQFSANLVGTPAWIATNRFTADFAVRFDLLDL